MLTEIEGAPKKIHTHGIDFYVYPEAVPSKFTGCQIVWLENGHKLITKHYELGKISWVKGQEPKDVLPFFCLYDDGKLNEAASFNVKRCPKHSQDLE